MINPSIQILNIHSLDFVDEGLGAFGFTPGLGGHEGEALGVAVEDSGGNFFVEVGHGLAGFPEVAGVVRGIFVHIPNALGVPVVGCFAVEGGAGLENIDKGESIVADGLLKHGGEMIDIGRKNSSDETWTHAHDKIARVKRGHNDAIGGAIHFHTYASESGSLPYGQAIIFIIVMHKKNIVIVSNAVH